MTKSTEPELPPTHREVGQTHDSHGPGTDVVLDPDTFRDFIDLLGQAKARYWLGEFRDALKSEFTNPLGQVNDAETSRANIHKFSAQAGVIGFKALHEACSHFLENGESGSGPLDPYERVRAQAERVLPEIERLRATIS